MLLHIKVPLTVTADDKTRIFGEVNTALTNPGTYAVVATINETNYTGKATGTFTFCEVLG